MTSDRQSALKFALAATLTTLVLCVAAGIWLPNAHASPASTTAIPSSEWLVTTSSTCLTPLLQRRALELFNNGPNNIYCNLQIAAVVNKGRPIQPGTSWAMDLGDTVPVCCIAATANQLTTAATIVTQVK